MRPVGWGAPAGEGAPDGEGTHDGEGSTGGEGEPPGEPPQPGWQLTLAPVVVRGPDVPGGSAELRPPLRTPPSPPLCTRSPVCVPGGMVGRASLLASRPCSPNQVVNHSLELPFLGPRYQAVPHWVFAHILPLVVVALYVAEPRIPEPCLPPVLWRAMSLREL